MKASKKKKQLKIQLNWPIQKSRPHMRISKSPKLSPLRLGSMSSHISKGALYNWFDDWQLKKEWKDMEYWCNHSNEFISVHLGIPGSCRVLHTHIHKSITVCNPEDKIFKTDAPFQTYFYILPHKPIDNYLYPVPSISRILQTDAKMPRFGNWCRHV